MAYANKILKGIDDDYHEIVRDILKVNSDFLPDIKIDRMDGVRLAETIMIKRVADYGYLIEDDLLFLQTATMYCVAALMSKQFSESNIKSEKLGDYQYEVFNRDWGSEEQDFWSKVEEHLAQISSYQYEEKKLLEFEGGT